MTTPPEGGRRTVGVFDIRLIIGGLIGIYGLILTLLGLFSADADELARDDGININLWAGIGMLIFAAAFAAWTRWRPLVVPDDVVAESDDTSRPSGH